MRCWIMLHVGWRVAAMSDAKRRRVRLSAGSQVRDIENALNSGVNSSTHQQEVLIDKIRPDPDNSRKIYLDYSNPRVIDQDSPHAERATKQLEEAESLASSIRAQGLINAVDVYRVGDSFQLIMGHMRYIAHLLNGAETIKANVHSNRPRNIAVLQYIENFHRSELSFDVRYNSLVRALEEEFDRQPLVDVSSDLLLETLTEKLGISRTQGFRWKRIVTADPQIRELIMGGHVMSLAQAYELSDMDAADRVSWIRETVGGDVGAFNPSSAETTEGNNAQAGTSTGQTNKPASKAHRVVRPLRHVKVKPVKDKSVIKELISRSVGLEKFEDVDWSDYQQVTIALERTLKMVGEDILKGNIGNKHTSGGG